MAIGTSIGAQQRHQHAAHQHAHAHSQARARAAAAASTAAAPAARFDIAAPTTAAAVPTATTTTAATTPMAGMGCAGTSGGTAGTPLDQAIATFLAAVGGGAAAAAATAGAGALAAPTSGVAVPAGTSTATLGRAPTAATGATGTGAALIGQVTQTVAGSSLATEVLGQLQQHGARIDVVDDASFNAKFAGAGGVYLPSEDRIVLPKSAANDPRKLALVLVHEGTHWLQDHVGTGKLDTLGGPLAQALQGAGALQVGTGGPNSKDAEWHDEAQAYLVESLAAHQLGLNDPGLGSDARTGATLTYAQTLARVKAEPLYQ